METTMTAASARKKMPCPTEGVEQATLFSWASMRTYWYPELALMFHIPNGGKRSKAEAGRFRAEGEKYIGEPIFRFVIGSNVYNAYQRPGTLGVLFINAAYLKPLLGGEDDPELYLRSDNSFTGEYIAVKQGLMLAAIIEPELGILSASLVENVSAFANAAHSEIDRMVGIPDTDPETGEIV